MLLEAFFQFVGAFTYQAAVLNMKMDELCKSISKLKELVKKMKLGENESKYQPSRDLDGVGTGSRKLTRAGAPDATASVYCQLHHQS